jgi:lysozyme
VVEGMTISQAQADQFLAGDAAHAVGTVAAVARATPAINQFDAMVSLCFNIGGHSFRTSTVLRQHRAGNHLAAGDAFLMWDKDHQDGQLVVVPGLLKRRQIERAYYLNVPVG